MANKELEALRQQSLAFLSSHKLTAAGSGFFADKRQKAQDRTLGEIAEIYHKLGFSATSLQGELESESYNKAYEGWQSAKAALETRVPLRPHTKAAPSNSEDDAAQQFLTRPTWTATPK